jgi:hypothetical protein
VKKFSKFVGMDVHKATIVQALHGQADSGLDPSVIGRGCKNEREIARSFGFDETPLERRNQFLGRADANGAWAANHIAVGISN